MHPADRALQQFLDAARARVMTVTPPWHCPVALVLLCCAGIPMAVIYNQIRKRFFAGQ